MMVRLDPLRAGDRVVVEAWRRNELLWPGMRDARGQRHLQKRPYLKREWYIAVLQRPTRCEPQGDSRFRFWAPVEELGGRYLRVITLADKVTVLNAFPDRDFKP